jgi:DNA-binding XRE family transcriptional regulator
MKPIEIGNNISYNIEMKKNNFREQTNSRFKLTQGLFDWLSNYPEYKDQIKIIRKALGLTQEQLARKIDHTPRSIRTIENGEALPKITTLQKIADALNAELIISLIPEKDISEFLKEKTEPAGDSNDFQIGETD